MRKNSFLQFFFLFLLLVGSCNSESKAPQENAAAPATADAVVRELSWGNVMLRVETVPSNGSASLNDITITGQVGDAKLQPVMISGSDPVIEAGVADIDNDNNPELYCFTQGAGSGSYGTVIAYVIFPEGSVAQINMQSMSASMQEGYMGHDAFTVENGRLVRTFPVYREGDANNNPTGGSRKVFYELQPGEAAPQLVAVGME